MVSTNLGTTFLATDEQMAQGDLTPVEQRTGQNFIHTDLHCQ